MRLVILVAAFGLVSALPVAAPIFSPKAEAQQASPNDIARANETNQGTMTMEEQTLQAQIVALAQAGNTDGLKALIRAKVAAGKGAMVAKVAKAIAAMGANLAGSDGNSAAALVNAAVLIASDASVIAADPTVTDTVGASASNAVATARQNNDPAAASSIQSAVARSGNSSLLTAYNQANMTLTRMGNQQQDNSNQTLRHGTPTGGGPLDDNDQPPVIAEPNPAQAGSPT